MRRSAMRSAATLLFLLAACVHARYHGREIGALSQLHHGVKGTVYAVDARTLYIHDFQYDGVGPAAYFYVGTSGKPTATGAIRLRDERGGTSPLRKYRGEGVTVSLPDGITLKDVKWFSVWCDEYAVNFGDVTIPRDLEYPKPAKVGALRGVHGVSSDQVVVVDAQTLLIPNFSYDGEAPDAKFWVGRGETPSPQGIRIPDENGKEAPLRKYDKKTIVLTLPGELTVFDIGHFAVWCEAFTVNFGHVVLSRAALANVPPSLKMLGVSPQSRNTALAATARAPARAHRPKIAKVDATTYRPALALAAGPRASPDHRPATHEHLHRREYPHSSNEQLVQVQTSRELHFKEYQSQDDLYRQYQDQKQRLEELQRQYQQTQHAHKQLDDQEQDLYNQQIEQKEQQGFSQHQYQQDDRQQQQQNQYQEQNRQQQDLYSHQNKQKDKQSESQLQYQQRDGQQQHQNQHERYRQEPQRQNYQQHQNQQQYSREDERAQYQRQLYERQLYEQQRLAYERELLQQRQSQDEEPFRYRLLPYSFGGGR